MTDASETSHPAPVSEATTPAGAVRARWAWTAPEVWTARMLTALEQGVRGGQWYTLIDKVYAPATLRAAFARVKANRGAPGVDHVFQRWPINFFAAQGLLSLAEAHATYRQSAMR